MSKKLKILIPQGLSNTYLNLVPLINIFESNSNFSEICLYHAYQPPHFKGKNLPTTLKQLVKDDERNIEKIQKNQAKMFKALLHSKTEVTTTFKKNSPVNGIKSFTKKYKPDIIMLATDRQNAISKFINNSNALKLMNGLHVPFLIMPKDYSFKKQVRLNFLLKDFKNLELAKSKSKSFKNIFEDIRFIHRDPKKKAKSTKDIKVIDSITDYVKDSKYDEVFMLIRKKKGPLQKGLSKGFVDRLIGINQAPVIIIND